MELTKPYNWFLDEIAKDDYKCWTVYDYFFTDAEKDPSKKHVILRVDVDNGLHLCRNLSEELEKRNLPASIYFLTPRDGRYNVFKGTILKELQNQGIETGLHSNHYYHQVHSGEDAIKLIKGDAMKFSKASGNKHLGMVYHGMVLNSDSRPWNWYAYNKIPPKKLGLFYHDGLKSPYTKEDSDMIWAPNTDKHIADYLMTNNGWNYAPFFPQIRIRKVKGGSLHVAIHVLNMFKWWKEEWAGEFEEKAPARPNILERIKKTAKANTYALLKA